MGLGFANVLQISPGRSAKPKSSNVQETLQPQKMGPSIVDQSELPVAISEIEKHDHSLSFPFCFRECTVRCNQGYAFPHYSFENSLSAPGDAKRVSQVNLKCQGNDIWAPTDGSVTPWPKTGGIPSCERKQVYLLKLGSRTSLRSRISLDL